MSQFEVLREFSQEHGLDAGKPVVAVADDEVNPTDWFQNKYPNVHSKYGDAVEIRGTKKTRVVSSISEDFLAGILGDLGSPDRPTVFLSSEQKFFRFETSSGIYVDVAPDELAVGLSRLLDECASECKTGVDLGNLRFRFRNTNSQKGILQRARGILAAPADFFQTGHNEYIATATGMLRLADRTILPFEPIYRRRTKLAVEFVPGATCPRFLDELLRPALSEEDIDLLQRATGLFLIGKNPAQVIVLIVGTAGAGKGTFVRIIKSLLGPGSIATLRPKLLLNRFELGGFLGRTLLYGADETQDFLNCEGAHVLKTLTGGDPVSVELKNGNGRVDIKGEYNVLICSNSWPTIRLESDAAAWKRRLRIVEFRRECPAEPIFDLDQQIIQQEGSGVLNWALDGLDRLRARNFVMDLTVGQKQRIERVLGQSDSCRHFVEQRCHATQGAALTQRNCYSAYVEFCRGHEWNPEPQDGAKDKFVQLFVANFGVRLRHDAPPAGVKADRWWSGVALKP